MALATASLSACAPYIRPGEESGALKANVPANYRARIADMIHKDLFDPYSVRDAKISEPFVFGNTIVVCVSYNAKNKFGAYTGLQEHAYSLVEGRVQTFFGDDASPCVARGPLGPYSEIGNPN